MLLLLSLRAAEWLILIAGVLAGLLNSNDLRSERSDLWTATTMALSDRRKSYSVKIHQHPQPGRAGLCGA